MKNHHARWFPRAMRIAPPLDHCRITGPVQARHALLINPFYPKDPLASFGKHVLTPTLALTSVAAATPPDWTVDYWDENLLQGPPPWRPFPQAVGISVHLTFAKRAYELVEITRRRHLRFRRRLMASTEVSRQAGVGTVISAGV